MSINVLAQTNDTGGGTTGNDTGSDTGSLDQKKVARSINCTLVYYVIKGLPGRISFEANNVPYYVTPPMYLYDGSAEGFKVVCDPTGVVSFCFMTSCVANK